MPDSYFIIILEGNACMKLINLSDGSPRLDRAYRACGQRRAHRCQPIIPSAASDLKWPFNLFVRSKWTRGGGVLGASVHSDYSIVSISNGEMKHRQWCPLILACICWIPLLIRHLVWRRSLHRLRACEERGASLFCLHKIPPPSRAPSRRNGAADP